MAVRRVPCRSLLALTAALVGTLATSLRSADDRLDYQPAAYAIQGARIMAGRGVQFEDGTVVVRQGVITAVGPSAEVPIPFDAETIDGKGLVVYPGFVDLYTTRGVPPGVTRSRTGPGRSISFSDYAVARTPEDDHSGITPEFEVASVLDLPNATAETYRKLGFTAALAAPEGAIVTGRSAMVSLSGLPRREAIVRSPVALHINLRTPFEPEGPRDPGTPGVPPGLRRRSPGSVSYPASLMGVVAHLRQAMLDAEFHHAQATYHRKHGGARPAADPALDVLKAARNRSISVWWEANTRDEIHRALDLAEEFGTDAVIVGGREAARVADRLKALDVPVVFRLNAQDEPKVPGAEEYQRRSPEARDEPLRAIGHRAARWKEQVGTPAALAKAGVRFGFSTDGLSKPETFPEQLRKIIQAGLSADAAIDALTRQAAEIAGLGRQLGTIEPGKLGHLVVLTGPLPDEKSKVRYVLIDGTKFDLEKARSTAREESKKAEPAARKPGPSSARPETRGETETARAVTDRVESASEPEPGTKPSRSSDSPAQMKRRGASAIELADEVRTELDEDRKPRLRTGGNVLIKDALILTVGPAGTIPRGSILIRDGKIAAVGADLDPPSGVTVIDARGLVAMPGIIDTHSHIAIQGGVNEMSLSIVPEVRVRDVVASDDIAIYRALAGGVTTARLLHGSANAIGGQDAIIKLRYGQPARELILNDSLRPQGIKFALGENVTRRVGRFPNTRMGVEATIERAFEEARAYQQRWNEYQKARSNGDTPPPPRRDLRLEALARVLDGTIKVHSHCYRGDEILMLLNLAERHGVRIQSLQHVLEGYKVAPEIAAHGASASTFSDWWAYKVEAYDAIPFNAALLTEAGVRVCIKSDSDELIRHLNLEAAKMLRYGRVPESEALAMITLNPARELGLDHRLGSIEVGKDGDIALFNGHPFDSFTRCEWTIIDGEVWFQRPVGPDPSPTGADGKTVPRPSPDVFAKAIDLEPSPNGVYALKGALLHPVSSADIPNGTIVLSKGRITAIGGPETPVPDQARVIDLQGLDVWPGMIDAGSILGLYEVGSLGETQDHSDSAQIQPELRSSRALHTDSAIIPVTRANGVLASFIQPTGGLIAGQGCVVSLAGWVPREMILADPAALVVAIPPYRRPDPDRSGRSGPGGGTDPNRERAERLDRIRDVFRRAIDYDRVVQEAKRQGVLPPIPDPRLAALVPYATGARPVVFLADRRVEILDAIQITADLKLKAIISGGLEAWKVAKELKKAEIPVLLAGTLRIPAEEYDPYDAAYANPARLEKAGVRFAFRSQTSGPDAATGPRNLPFNAATAVAFGLPETSAIRSVTLSPAEILGVADKLGSLEPGKLAHVVITAGHLLQATGEVKGVFISGVPYTPTSRQSQLYETYRQRLARVRDGSAPLGLDRPRPSESTGTPSLEKVAGAEAGAP